MHKLEQHQQITPLAAESVADQGVAYLKYQQALIFPFEGSIFNALMVLGLTYSYPRVQIASRPIFVPNVNSRPVRIKNLEAWTKLLDEAYVTYEKACLIYEAELEEVRIRVTKVFDSPFIDTDLGDENDSDDGTSDKD